MSKIDKQNNHSKTTKQTNNHVKTNKQTTTTNRNNKHNEKQLQKEQETEQETPQKPKKKSTHTRNKVQIQHTCIQDQHPQIDQQTEPKQPRTHTHTHGHNTHGQEIQIIRVTGVESVLIGPPGISAF